MLALSCSSPSSPCLLPCSLPCSLCASLPCSCSCSFSRASASASSFASRASITQNGSVRVTNATNECHRFSIVSVVGASLLRTYHRT